jgi:hypothetical protein
MTYNDFELIQTTNDAEWPKDLPAQFPEFAHDIALPPPTSFMARNERQAIEQVSWAEDKIGILTKKELFYNGLSPVDFLRAFHDKHDDLDKIDELLNLDAETDTGKLFYTKMGLSAQHINNQFTDEELENLCYERPGSQRWYVQRLTEKLGCDASEIPEEIVNAIQECNIQKSLGRASFRNYMRRVNKSLNQKTGKTKPKGKKKKGFLTITNENTILSFK